MTSVEAVDTVQEMVKQLVKDIKDRKLVPELQDRFEGGQMPLYRRLPKRGFKNRNTKEIVGINVEALNRFEDGAEVTIAALVESGLVSNPKDGVKILGNGELTKKLTVKVTAVSEGAKAKIEAAGGTVEVI